MCFSSPSMPAVPTPVLNPREQDQAVQQSLDAERRRRAQAAGLASTLLTGGQGVTTPATTAPKKLLGE